MTEAEWLACDDPDRMLAFLRVKGRASERKLRLFACACCRLVQDLLTEQHLAAVSTAESFANGVGSSYGLLQARRAARFGEGAIVGPSQLAAGAAADSTCLEVAYNAALDTCHCVGQAQAGKRRWPPPPTAGAPGLMREVFGNPFNPPAVSTAWLGWDRSTALNVAWGMYNDGTFDRLPILADALEDAGCSDPGLLGHLRSPGPHVRGCWALDLILGKE
jgi:hypothetical protein